MDAPKSGQRLVVADRMSREDRALSPPGDRQNRGRMDREHFGAFPLGVMSPGGSAAAYASLCGLKAFPVGSPRQRGREAYLPPMMPPATP